VNVNVKRNDASVDVNFSPNVAMAALGHSGQLPSNFMPNGLKKCRFLDFVHLCMLC